jgi:hypothetical protein
MKIKAIPHLNPVISVSMCVGRLKVKKWLKEKHSKHWATMPGMKQPKLLLGNPSDKLSRDLMALDRKQHRLVLGLLTGHCTLGQHLHIMALSEGTKCRKRRHEAESSSHSLCQCSVLAEHYL